MIIIVHGDISLWTCHGDVPMLCPTQYVNRDINSQGQLDLNMIWVYISDNRLFVNVNIGMYCPAPLPLVVWTGRIRSRWAAAVDSPGLMSPLHFSRTQYK